MSDIRYARHRARIMGPIAFGIFVGNPKGDSPLGRRRRTWINSVEIYFGIIRYGGMDWINQFLV